MRAVRAIIKVESPEEKAARIARLAEQTIHANFAYKNNCKVASPVSRMQRRLSFAASVMNTEAKWDRQKATLAERVAYFSPATRAALRDHSEIYDYLSQALLPEVANAAESTIQMVCKIKEYIESTWLDGCFNQEILARCFMEPLFRTSLFYLAEHAVCFDHVRSVVEGGLKIAVLEKRVRDIRELGEYEKMNVKNRHRIFQCMINADADFKKKKEDFLRMMLLPACQL